MFQHQVDLADYALHISFYRFGLAHHLAGQPLRFMMQVRAQSVDIALVCQQPYTVLSVTLTARHCCVKCRARGHAVSGCVLPFRSIGADVCCGPRFDFTPFVAVEGSVRRDLSRSLGAMTQDRSGRSLFSLDVQHEKLLHPA